MAFSCTLLRMKGSEKPKDCELPLLLSLRLDGSAPAQFVMESITDLSPAQPLLATCSIACLNRDG